MKKDIAYVL